MWVAVLELDDVDVLLTDDALVDVKLLLGALGRYDRDREEIAITSATLSSELSINLGDCTSQNICNNKDVLAADYCKDGVEADAGSFEFCHTAIDDKDPYLTLDLGEVKEIGAIRVVSKTSGKPFRAGMFLGLRQAVGHHTH